MKQYFKRLQRVDQTSLVNQLLSFTAEGIISCEWRNSSRYRAITSRGIFEGTDVHYFAVLDQLQHKMDKAKRKKRRNQLLYDIRAIEDGYQGERMARRWYALPSEYADKMVAEGYMVLRVADGYWWVDDQKR